jgi:hypothetical protein
MTTRTEDDHARRRALADLERLGREPDVGGTHMGVTAPPAAAEPPDRVEVWATWAGRGLAVAFALGLLWMLLRGG